MPGPEKFALLPKAMRRLKIVWFQKKTYSHGSGDRTSCVRGTVRPLQLALAGARGISLFGKTFSLCKPDYRCKVISTQKLYAEAKYCKMLWLEGGGGLECPEAWQE
jgi:hypothetical protein